MDFFPNGFGIQHTAGLSSLIFASAKGLGNEIYIK